MNLGDAGYEKCEDENDTEQEERDSEIHAGAKAVGAFQPDVAGNGLTLLLDDSFLFAFFLCGR